MADVSVSQQAKRKRGRPRKDNNLCRDGGLQSPENSSLTKTELLGKCSNNGSTDSSSMVGSVVYGVIEGSFDAGYLISVTIGNETTPFRGVVFQPKKIVPISAANDIAPQAKMYERRAVAIPISDNLNQTSVISPPSQPERASKQAVLRPPSAPTSSSNPFSNADLGKQQLPNIDPSATSLRMVEEDEVMQAFEVSTSAGGGSGSTVQLHHNLMDKNMPQSTFQIQQDAMIGHDIEHPRPFFQNGPTVELLHETPKATKAEEVQQPMYYNELTGTNISFHQNLFTQPKPLPEAQFGLVSTSHNLKLGLDKPEPQSETCYGFHQALVAGNPLLLPPELMMEKTNSEQESRDDERLVGDNSDVRTRPTTETNYCMTDMNFVPNNTVQIEASETTHTQHSTDLYDDEGK